MANPANAGFSAVDSLVRAQVAAAAAKVLSSRSKIVHSAGNSNNSVVKSNFSGNVGPGCTLFVAPPPEMNDETVDALLEQCSGLIGRELTMDKRGKVVFGFFRTSQLAMAAIEKLQESDPPLYGELGERPSLHFSLEGNEKANSSKPFSVQNESSSAMTASRSVEGTPNGTVLEVGEPHHTLRVSCPQRSLVQMEEMLTQLSGVEDQRVDAKNVAWVRFSSVKTATAVLEYFSGLKDDENWAVARITYAKKLDDTSSDSEEARSSRERQSSKKRGFRDRNRSHDDYHNSRDKRHAMNDRSRTKKISQQHIMHSRALREYSKDAETEKWFCSEKHGHRRIERVDDDRRQVQEPKSSDNESEGHLERTSKPGHERRRHPRNISFRSKPT